MGGRRNARNTPEYVERERRGMIEIKKTGICEECTKAALFLTDERKNMFDDPDWRLHCEHEKACERAEKVLAIKRG